MTEGLGTAQHVSGPLCSRQRTALLNPGTDRPSSHYECGRNTLFLQVELMGFCCIFLSGVLSLECFTQLQYHREPVEALRGLWEQVNGRHTPVWDLSLNTLRQVVLSIPETDGEIRETCLSQFNSLMLELQRPQIHTPPVTSHIISLQLWRELMDSLVNESVRLRHKLGLPENNTWSETTHNHHTLEQMEEQRTEGALLMKDAMRRASVRELEESRAAEERGSVKKLVPEERRTGAGERDSSFTTESAEHKHTPQDTYRALLHTQVYALMERMVDSLCDLLHESQTAY